MPNASKNITANFGGHGFSNDQATADYDTELSGKYPLPAGKLVTDWVKTDLDTAACNLPAGHGYTSGKFDVYFAAGRRYGVDGTVTGNALALDGGVGTDFPATAAADVVCTKQVQIDRAITGANMKFLAVTLDVTADPTAKGHADFRSAAPASVWAIDLVHEKAAGGGANIYNVQGGDTNPLAGVSVATVMASNGSSTQAATLYVYAGVDQTP